MSTKTRKAALALYSSMNSSSSGYTLVEKNILSFLPSRIGLLVALEGTAMSLFGMTNKTSR
jgi:hypothetical protein